ncbi:MAG: hypothetical protein V4675_22640 [Verrucomicrobiota bacterium]
MERLARRATRQDDEDRRSILRIVEEAGLMALKGTLTQSIAQNLISRLTEAATGEKLHHAGIEEWLRGWLKEKSGSHSQGTAVRYEGVIDSFIASLPKAQEPVEKSTNLPECMKIGRHGDWLDLSQDRVA